MKILHILRNPDDETAMKVALEQSEKHEVSLLFIQDGVYSLKKEMKKEMVYPFRVFFCRDDLQARGLNLDESLDYDQIVDLIFSHDRVISW